MKRSILVFSLVALSVTSNAQFCYWATDFGGVQNEDNYGMTTDASGNIIVTGAFSSPSMSIGSNNLINAGTGYADYYIAKYNSAGTVLWAQRTGQNIDDVGKCVATDATGNIYVAGYFGTDTIFFGSLFAVNSAYGNFDMFLVKYDANGNPLWVRSSAGTNDEVPFAMTIDGGGNVVVTGKHGAASMTVSSSTISNPGFGSNIFVASWDANGNFNWLKGAGRANDDAAWGISDDNGNGIYVTGFFRSDTLFFGSQYAVNNMNGNEDMFVAKLDNAGNAVYVRAIGGDDADYGCDVVADVSGNCYLTGKWRSTSITVGTSTYSAPSNFDLLFVKFDPTGNVVWSSRPTGSAQDDARSIGIDANGDIYACGDYQGNMTFSTNSLPQVSGGSDIYLVKYNSAGVEQWATSIPCVGNTFSYNVAVTGVNDLFVAGSYGGTSLAFGSYNLGSAGGFDGFIAHVYGYTTSIASSTNVSCFGGSDGSATVAVSGGFAPFTYAWVNSGQTTATANGLGTGYDTAFVTDANGCVSLSTVLISQPTQLTGTISHLDIDCSLGQSGSGSIAAAGGTLPYSYLWSNGDTVSSISNVAAGTYYITVTDLNGCTISDSAVIMAVPAPVAPLCMVTVDSASQFNIIIWDDTPFTNVDSFIVYREINTNDYRRIGAVSISDSSFFIDTVRTLYFPNTGDPNQGTYRYKLQTLDTCGAYGPLSPYHNTIFIIDNSGTFSWPQLYTIEGGPNPVTSYVLWRDNVSDGNWIPVSSVAGTQQVVSDPGYATYQTTASWRVQTLWNITCNPSLRMEQGTFISTYNSSFSNLQGQALMTGVQHVNLQPVISVYPTVTDGIFTLSTTSFDDATVEVYSSLGELVYTSQLTEQATVLNLSENPSGVYFVKVFTALGVVTEMVIRQ